MKSSLKGKVSSLFFPKNKKSSKEKFSASLTKDTSQKSDVSVQSTGKAIVGTSQCANDSTTNECSLPQFQVSSSKTFLSDFSEQGIISREVSEFSSNHAKCFFFLVSTNSFCFLIKGYWLQEQERRSVAYLNFLVFFMARLLPIHPLRFCSLIVKKYCFPTRW